MPVQCDAMRCDAGNPGGTCHRVGGVPVPCGGVNLEGTGRKVPVLCGAVQSGEPGRGEPSQDGVATPRPGRGEMWCGGPDSAPSRVETKRGVAVCDVVWPRGVA